MKNQKSDYKKLKEFWYKKLNKSGFKDIEAKDGRLNEWTSKKFQYHKSGAWEAKRDYFILASRFLEEYKFEKKLHQVIWEYHSNGLTVREIAQILKSLKYKIKSKSPVFEIIKRMRLKMFDMYFVTTKEYHE